MELEEIERHTRAVLPEWGEGDLAFSIIEKGGSGRLFVRVSDAARSRSLIAMHYGLDRSDNARFAAVTDFLNRHHIPSPRLLARREELCLLWVEDLGEVDIAHLAGSDWAGSRRPAYELALRAVRPLHALREENAPEDLPELERPFDRSLYEWEQSYFLTHYVERFHGAEVAEGLRSHPELASLAEELGSLPRSLVHRDFQSTNVMLREGKAYLIDYQGLRWGRPEYDLASLVYDPYSDFTPEETRDLVDFYYALACESGEGDSREDFERRLVQCGTQRLMQALGAYGFLGEVKGKREFLAHIPVARQRLLDLSRREGGLGALVDLLV